MKEKNFAAVVTSSAVMAAQGISIIGLDTFYSITALAIRRIIPF